MHLNDLAELVGQHAAERYAVKRGFLLPLVAGFAAGEAGQHGMGTYRKTRAQMDAATHQQLAPDVAKKASFSMPGAGQNPAANFAQGAGAAAGKGVSSGISDMAGLPLAGLANGLSGAMGKGLDRMFFGREFGERKDPAHMMGSAAIGSFGKGLGDLGVQLLQDIASKAVAAVGNAGQNSARQAILQQLKTEDPVLSNADDRVLMEAYHTMSRFAPVLSTDKNAVRSFLRQAVMSGSGADFTTIKLLADSERAVTGEKK
jgi:hypothetical protein